MVVKAIKGTKLKVQVAIQGDELRISAKKRDDLQGAIALVKDLEITQPLQYIMATVSIGAVFALSLLLDVANGVLILQAAVLLAVLLFIWTRPEGTFS